jgi:hypothetical protein
VEAVLGKPDLAAADKLMYNREVQKKTTPQEFAELRKDYPEKMSDKEAHEKFDSYTQEIYIEARFSESRLIYLAVSRSGFID